MATTSCTAPDLQLQVNGLDLQLDNLSLSDADTQQLLGLARLQIGQAGMTWQRSGSV